MRSLEELANTDDPAIALIHRSGRASLHAERWDTPIPPNMFAANRADAERKGLTANRHKSFSFQPSARDRT
jgi:hypothetical protein